MALRCLVIVVILFNLFIGHFYGLWQMIKSVGMFCLQDSFELYRGSLLWAPKQSSQWVIILASSVAVPCKTKTSLIIPRHFPEDYIQAKVGRVNVWSVSLSPGEKIKCTNRKPCKFRRCLIISSLGKDFKTSNVNETAQSGLLYKWLVGFVN